MLIVDTAHSGKLIKAGRESNYILSGSLMPVITHYPGYWEPCAVGNQITVFPAGGLHCPGELNQE